MSDIGQIKANGKHGVERRPNYRQERDPKSILRDGYLRIVEREIEIDRRADCLRRFIDLGPPKAHDVAEISAEIAGLELCISPPTVRTMTVEQMRRDPSALGWASLSSDNVIHVRFHGVCNCEIASVVAHETRHRYQMVNKLFISLIRKGQSEADADKFKNTFISKYLRGVSCSCVALKENRQWQKI